MNESDVNHLKLLMGMDQFREAVKTIPPVVWMYFTQLTEQGFTHEQAFALTREFQALFLTSAFNKK